MGVVSIGSICVPLYICSPPYIYMPSVCLYAPYLPVHLNVLLGASVHLSGISVSVSTSIFLSVHKNHTCYSPSL